MSLSINTKVSFIDSFQFLSSSLDSLVKNLAKDDFKYLSQELHDVFYLVKQKGFYSYEYMSDFEPITNQRFYSSLIGKKITEKEYEHVLKVWKKFEIKAMKDYQDFYLKYDILLLADVSKKLLKE